MNRLFTAIVSVSLLAACGGGEPENDVITPPQRDNDKLAIQLDRRPFYKANPESSAPSSEIISDEYALLFTGWGAEEPRFTLNFPEGERRRVILEYTMGSIGRGPAEYDYTTMLFIHNKADDQWYEIVRAFTPFGGAFDSEWEKRFYIDVTEYSSMLQGDTEFRYFYGGFDGSEERAHSFKLRFLLYDGEAPRELLCVKRLYDSYNNGNSGYRGWAYGVEGHDIEAAERLGVREVEIPDGAGDMELRLSITGHGHDLGTFPDIAGYTPQNMAEFVENSYSIVIDGHKQAASGRIFYSNADNYVQQGTYIYDRANWAPGNPANIHYWDVARSNPEYNRLTIDVDLPRFCSSFDAPNAEGVAQYIVIGDLYIYKR